jgi:hypothetical protein
MGLGKTGLSVTVIVAAALGAYYLFAVSEVIDVEAISDSAITISAHGQPKIFTLGAGRLLPVKRCVPRKTDIDIEVVTPAGIGTIQGSKFRVLRRPATLSERIAGKGTASCFGLL